MTSYIKGKTQEDVMGVLESLVKANERSIVILYKTPQELEAIEQRIIENFGESILESGRVLFLDRKKYHEPKKE